MSVYGEIYQDASPECCVNLHFCVLACVKLAGATVPGAENCTAMPVFAFTIVHTPLVNIFPDAVAVVAAVVVAAVPVAAVLAGVVPVAAVLAGVVPVAAVLAAVVAAAVVAAAVVAAVVAAAVVAAAVVAAAVVAAAVAAVVAENPSYSASLVATSNNTTVKIIKIIHIIVSIYRD